MYYEEKIINGVLCWRGTPDGQWIQKTAEQLTEMLNKARQIEREACKEDCRKAAEIAVGMYGANAECTSTVDECLRIIDERSL